MRVLLFLGAFGTAAAVLASAVVLIARLRGDIPVLGYTPVVLAIAFFGGLTTLGLGIVGRSSWLTLQNALRRPNFIVESVERFGP